MAIINVSITVIINPIIAMYIRNLFEILTLSFKLATGVDIMTIV